MSANGGSARDRHRARSLSSASSSVRRRPLSQRSVSRRLPVKRRLFTPRTPQLKSVEVNKSPDGGGCGSRSITVPASSSPTVINVHCDKRCSPLSNTCNSYNVCNPCNTCPVFDGLGYPHWPVYSPPVWVTTSPLSWAPSVSTPYLPQVPYLPPLAPIPECTSVIPYPACPDPWLNRTLLPQVCW